MKRQLFSLKRFENCAQANRSISEIYVNRKRKQIKQKGTQMDGNLKMERKEYENPLSNEFKQKSKSDCPKYCVVLSEHER